MEIIKFVVDTNLITHRRNEESPNLVLIDADQLSHPNGINIYFLFEKHLPAPNFLFSHYTYKNLVENNENN